MPWLFLILAVVAETIGTSALKASEGFSRPVPSLVVPVAYGISFWLLAMVLRSIPVGIAYAIWSGLGVVLIAVIGRIAFGQRLDGPALAGIALILAGIVVMQVFSDTTGG